MKYQRAAALPPQQSGWAITFADLMGLLVCFFVMLTVLLSQDSESIKNVTSSFRKAFKSEGKSDIIVLVPPKPDEQDKRLEALIKQALKKDVTFAPMAENTQVLRRDGKLTLEIGK